VPIYRNGKIEDVYWTYSYSPVLDEAGNHAGILATCSETTDNVLTFKRLAEGENSLLFAMEAAGLGTWGYRIFGFFVFLFIASVVAVVLGVGMQIGAWAGVR